MFMTEGPQPPRTPNTGSTEESTGGWGQGGGHWGRIGQRHMFHNATNCDERIPLQIGNVIWKCARTNIKENSSARNSSVHLGDPLWLAVGKMPSVLCYSDLISHREGSVKLVVVLPGTCQAA